MSERVLTTTTASSAINRMQQILKSPLSEQIHALRLEGRNLSAPDVWDGRVAREFRAVWPDVERQLLNATNAIEELRQRVDVISNNIMSAGGKT